MPTKTIILSIIGIYITLPIILTIVYRWLANLAENNP